MRSYVTNDLSSKLGDASGGGAYIHTVMTSELLTVEHSDYTSSIQNIRTIIDSIGPSGSFPSAASKLLCTYINKMDRYVLSTSLVCLHVVLSS